MRVLLADDHPLFRTGLREAIAHRLGLTVVGEASTGETALALAAEAAPDLIVIGIHLPDMDGIEVIRRVVRVLPTVRIVVFAIDLARSRVDDALRAGASAYLSKRSTIEEVTKAIEIVASGQLYVSPEVNVAILEEYRKGLVEELNPTEPLLSVREKRLLRLVAEGRRSKEIAVELTVSAKSVEAYRSRLMRKLGCSSSAELVRYAIREGIAAA